jgi:hypothetical protein
MDILINENLILVDGNIKSILDPYSEKVFELPNFIINDPIYTEEAENKILSSIEEKVIQVLLFNNKGQDSKFIQRD